MKKWLVIVVVLFGGSPLFAQVSTPCDKLATNETVWLYGSMQRLVGAGVLFGHHDDTAYGVGWKNDDNRSDVKSVCGSYPSVYEWDFSGLEHKREHDIDGTPFKLQRKLVRQAYDRGGINEFCWHMPNPANDKSAWDTTKNTVKDIIPGGLHHADYKQYLDDVAEYDQTLKGPDGEAIPILFRPFHELTGGWFWWGKNRCSAEEFKTLWRFTIDYMRKKKKLHNLLIVYSVADFDSEAEFLERYPGDNYVDFMGFDNYCYDKKIESYEKNLDKRLAMLDVIAAKHNKLACLAETGYLNIPQADWWTKVLLPILSKYKTSYVLVWRNAGMEQYYSPYPGQESANDFKKFSESDHTIFQNRLTPLAVYGKPTE